MSTFHATHGYRQLPLDEQSQPLTTFMRPWGCFKFLRAPMRLVSTGDEFSRRYAALVGLPNVIKAVDDILVHSEDFKSHVEQVWAFLCLCENITLPWIAKKSYLVKTEWNLSATLSPGMASRWTGKKQRYQRVSPPNQPQLQSFKGIVNQLGRFFSRYQHESWPTAMFAEKELWV